MFDKNRHKSDDRILVLRAIEGREEEAKRSISAQILKENNKVHLVMDPQYVSWSFKMEHGMLPKPLRQKFTSYSVALKAAKNFYEKQAIEIVEVID